MALKGSYTKNGTFTNAYFKISNISGSKEQGLTSVVDVYFDKSFRDASSKPIDNFNKSIDWDGTGNPYNLLYAALKLDFTSTIDI